MSGKQPFDAALHAITAEQEHLLRRLALEAVAIAWEAWLADPKHNSAPNPRANATKAQAALALARREVTNRPRADREYLTGGPIHLTG